MIEENRSIPDLFFLCGPPVLGDDDHAADLGRSTPDLTLSSRLRDPG